MSPNVKNEDREAYLAIARQRFDLFIRLTNEGVEPGAAINICDRQLPFEEVDENGEQVEETQ